MPVEFSEISNVSNYGSSDDGSSDDDLMDDHTSDDIDDLMMFSYLVANRRSVISRRPCRT